jgi:RNA polymerase sigma-70 factor (ECF subfamily)
MNTPELTEQDLLQKARKLDPKALATIYDRYNGEIYNYALGLIGDTELAEDCVSETFARFLDILKRHRGPDNYLRAYLYRMAHNWVTDQYRRGTLGLLPLDEATPIPSADDPAQEAQRNIRIQATRKALASLTPDQRQVISLRYLQGLELDEIAATLNKPVGAVKALQFRGIEALRRLLTEDENV